jgi:hypothetical protein
MDLNGAMDLAGTTLYSSFTQPVIFEKRVHSHPYIIFHDFSPRLHLNDIYS